MKKRKESPTTTLFISGEIKNFNQLNDDFSNDTFDRNFNDALSSVWEIGWFDAKDKLKIFDLSDSEHFEVGIQCIPGISGEFIKNEFLLLAQEYGFEPKPEYSIEVSNLWFLPIVGNSTKLINLATFSFVRVIRPSAK